MKKTLLLFCMATILWSPFAHSMDSDERQRIESLLTSAPWKMSASWWSVVRVFARGGTFTTLAMPKQTGRWKLTDKMIILTFADGHQDTLSLPLDPKGTNGISYHGDAIVAVIPDAANITATKPNAKAGVPGVGNTPEHPFGTDQQ
jgi:hypothetical protein